MKRIVTIIISLIVMLSGFQTKVFSLENKESNTTSGSIVAVVNGKVIKISNINESQYILSVESNGSEVKFGNDISNYLELLDINKNKVLLRDSTNAATVYYLLNLNNNSLEEIKDIHEIFEKNISNEVSKNKEKLYKITYYEHFTDNSGVIWFRYAVTLIGDDDFYVISGVANSNGKYYKTGLNGTVVNLTKGNDDIFYAVNVDETPSGNIMKNAASLLKINEDFTVKSFDLQYTETLKDSKIEVTDDNLIYILPALYKDDKYFYSLKCYKLGNSLEAVSNFPSLKDKILDVSKDINGKLYVLLQGEIKRINKNEIDDFLDLGSEKNYIQVYDEKNYMASNTYSDEKSNKKVFSYTYVLNEDLNREINNIEEDDKKILIYNKSSINKDSENTINIKSYGNNIVLKFDPGSINSGKGELKINASNLAIDIPFSPIIIKKYDVGDYISIEVSVSNLPDEVKNKYNVINNLYNIRALLRNSKNEIVKDYSDVFKNSNIKIEISEDAINTNSKNGIFSAGSIENSSCIAEGMITKNPDTVEFTVNYLGKFIVGELGEDNKLSSKEKVVSASSEKVLNSPSETTSSSNLTYYLYYTLLSFGGIITVLVIIWSIRRNKV